MLALTRTQIAMGIATLVTPLVWIASSAVMKALDRRWYRKHPGQSRTPAGDAPLEPYEPPVGLGYMRGVDADGQTSPLPPKRSWREIMRDL